MTFLIILLLVIGHLWYCIKIRNPFIQYGGENDPIFYSYRILGPFPEMFAFGGWTIILHKVVKGDPPDCFHGHEGNNYRIVFKGGYVEEVMRPDGTTYRRSIMPAIWPRKITFDYAHRFHSLANGKVSWTLWLKGPKTHKLKLYGTGWPDHVIERVNNAK